MSIFHSKEDIDKKLSQGITPLTESQIRFIIVILDRFSLKYNIKLLSYIKTITKVGFAIDDGFDFYPDGSFALRDALVKTKMFINDSESLVGKIASSQTDGVSFREIGGSEDKSLHCALGLVKCSVHLDETLFTPIGPDGKGYYNANLFQHIGHDLVWRFHIVRRLIDVPYLGWTLNHLHPYLPNSLNRYRHMGLVFETPKWNHIKFHARIKTTVNLKKPGLHHDFVFDPRNVMGLSGYNVEFGMRISF
jgi:hypothetical protein